MEKECKQCHVFKPLTEFYKHSQNSDRYFGKCKECVRARVRKRHNELVKNSEWHEKEKARHREKYYRLGYKDKHKPTYDQKKLIIKRYFEKYPEKLKAKNASAKMKPKKGYQKHHWSYNEEHYKDFIEMLPQDHAKLHRYMVYDQERMMYRTLEGVLLDTKERHLAYWEQVKDLD